MTLSLFGRSEIDPERVAAIRDWAYATLRVPQDVRIMVSELRCAEPGCPPLETVIAVMDPGRAPRQFKIHKPLAEVTASDVAALALPKGNPYDR